MLKSVLSAIPPIAGVVTIVAIAWFSNQVIFDEPAPSPLYQKTVEKAYSRFKESDINVPKGRKKTNAEARLEAFQAEAVGVSSDQVAGTETQDYLRACELSEAGRHDEAIEILEQLEKRHRLSDRTAIVHKIGDELRLAGRQEEAIETYREILKKDPNHLCCFVHIGEAYQSLQQNDMAERMFDNAEEGYERMIRRAGDQSRPHRSALVKFYLERHRKPEVALTLAEELVREDDTDPGALLMLAQCLDRATRTREAIDLLDRAVALEPTWKSTTTSYRNSLESRLATEAGQR